MASVFEPSAFNLGDRSEILDLTAPASDADGIVARWRRQSQAREPEDEDSGDARGE